MLFRRFYERTMLMADKHGGDSTSDNFMGLANAAERFVLSPSVTAACNGLAESDRQLKAAQAQIFAPFPTCWIEFESEYPIGFLWIGNPAKNPHRQGTMAGVTWHSGSNPLVMVPATVDLDRENPIWLDQALIEQMRKLEGKLPPPERFMEMLPTWQKALLASWALLATKGMTSSVVADMSKINKQRQKKGLYPLHGYQRIVLNLDVERMISNKVAIGTGRMPQHQVRAHLRLLRSGKVVVVRAHTRGNAEYGVRKSRYEVIRAEDLIR